MDRVVRFWQRRLVIIGALLAIGISCSSPDGPTLWPPLAAKTHDLFAENQATVDKLSRMLKESEYVLVSVYSSEEVRGYFTENGEGRSEILEDSANWSELMSVLNLETLLKRDSQLTFVGHISTDAAGRTGGPIYFHGDEFSPTMCREAFEGVPCGLCMMFRNEGWTARYMWFSGDHIDALSQSSSTDDSFVQASQKCIQDGLTEIGSEFPVGLLE